MSSTSSSSSSGGVGFFGLLGVAFIVLKLTGVIGWSWWWVTLPLWGPAAFWLAFFVLAALVVIAAKTFASNTRPRKRSRGPSRR